MRITELRLASVIALVLAACSPDATTHPSEPVGASRAEHARLPDAALDQALREALERHGFTGLVGQSLEQRLGRRLNQHLANTGRLLFFDPLLGLNNDNSCAGCHSPAHAFGDPQPIAIGIGNNGIVGLDRQGPRNQRRSPNLTSIAFAPKLMWNGRFFAGSDDPFNNAAGFHFPDPEGASLSGMTHLLGAQAFIPPTERVEMAGFAFPGDNDDIRAEVLRRVNAVQQYRARFGVVYEEVRRGAPLTYEHLAEAIAEFQFALVRMDAPIDRFARGQNSALTTSQKRGALLFFGPAGCSACHVANTATNELFSDFDNHVIGVPQIVPTLTNVDFDGPGANEDFGLEQITGSSADRYRFRTSPLRNVAVQPSFMHNGAFATLETAIRHHLDVGGSVAQYTTAHLPADLRGPLAPIAPVLDRLSPLLTAPIVLSEEEFTDLVNFVRWGLLDPGATPERMRGLVPERLPSGLRAHQFQFPTPTR